MNYFRKSESEEFLNHNLYISISSYADSILALTIKNQYSWLAFLMIAFTEENQGLHDLAAETYVVSKYWQGPVPLQDKFGA